MKLIVGLGNPGPQYEKTRHNAGFMAVDRLVHRHAPGVPTRSRFHALTVEASLKPRGSSGGWGGPAPAAGGSSSALAEGARCLLMKPLTFMNRSGLAVAEAVRFFKLDPAQDLLVLVDDIYLACGSIRLRGEGGSGGQNGLADIERCLGTTGYPRCRIGIDQPTFASQSDYVLERFSETQWSQVEPALEKTCDAAEVWASDGLSAAMNRFNVRDKKEQASPPGSPPLSLAPRPADAAGAASTRRGAGSAGAGAGAEDISKPKTPTTEGEPMKGEER